MILSKKIHLFIIYVNTKDKIPEQLPKQKELLFSSFNYIRNNKKEVNGINWIIIQLYLCNLRI